MSGNDRIDWLRVPVFGEPPADFAGTIRPSAYGIVADSTRRIAVVRTPLGLFLPGGGSDALESPEATVTRETREETGLTVRVGAWRRMAVEHGFSATEQRQFEKRCTFCDATVHAVGTSAEPDHMLEWVAAGEAAILLAPPSHRWAVGEWLVGLAPT
jgi:8-oxo-dGTP diphosphatase